jgi:hypothetical protein
MTTIEIIPECRVAQDGKAAQHRYGPLICRSGAAKRRRSLSACRGR